MAHFSFTFKLQQQDGRGEKKAQNDLKDITNASTGATIHKLSEAE